MKRIWFNNPALVELLADNGINLICNEQMDIVVADEDIERINSLIQELAPTAVEDYGFEDSPIKNLTIDIIPELFGKKIEWTAPSAKGNEPCGGIAIITDLRASDRPIIADIIEGDNLNYALCTDDVNVDFSDVGRGVRFKEI